MNMMKFVRNERGSVMVLMALALTALIGFLAVVADVGLLYLNRTELVSMADAAALAGARALVPGLVSNSPAAEAQDLANRNGLKAGDGFAVNVTGNAVTVTVTRKVDLFFAPVLGIANSNVKATAKAAWGGPMSATGVVPFGVEKQEFRFGEPYILKEGGGGGTTGNYGGLALGGNGANVYEFNIENGYSGVLHIGDQVPTKTGNMSGPTSEGVSYRMTQDPTATFPQGPDANYNSPRIITVPIIDSLDVNGHSLVTIVGFADFFLDGVGGSGNDNYVTGRFVRMQKKGEGTPSTGAYFGLYDIKLVQ